MCSPIDRDPLCTSRSYACPPPAAIPVQQQLKWPVCAKVARREYRSKKDKNKCGFVLADDWNQDPAGRYNALLNSIAVNDSESMTRVLREGKLDPNLPIDVRRVRAISAPNYVVVCQVDEAATWNDSLLGPISGSVCSRSRLAMSPIAHAVGNSSAFTRWQMSGCSHSRIFGTHWSGGDWRSTRALARITY
jgi:hypothetical protein